MSTTSTRPPLFDPEPNNGFDDDRPAGRQQFPARRGGGRSGGTTNGGSSSPKWVKPFMLGGLVLIALISLIGILSGGQASESSSSPTSPADEPDSTALTPATGDDEPGVTTDGSNATDGGNADDDAPAAQPSPDQAEATAPDTTTGSVPDAAPLSAELQQATAFAVQFAHDYLNLDEDAPEVRERNLRAYLAPDLDPQLGWDGQGFQLAVLTVPVLTEQRDDRVVVTVAAEVTGDGAPRWVHLAVSVAADSQGRWAVVSRPAFVPRPPAGTPEVDGLGEIDQALSNALAPAMEELFTAYASSGAVDVGGVTAPGAAIRGLDGQVTLQTVNAVRIAEDGADSRDGLVAVTWADDITGSTTTQTYRIVVVRTDDARWLVESVDAN